MSFTDDNFLKRQIPMSIRNLADDKSTNVALFGDVQNMDDIERDFDIVLSLLKYGADEIGEFSRDGWSVDIRADYEGEGPLVFGENRDQVYFWIKKQKKSKLWPFGKRELVILYKPANGEDYEALDPFVQKEGGALFFEFWNMLKKRSEKGVYFFREYAKTVSGTEILERLSTPLVREVFNNYNDTYKQGFWTQDRSMQVCFCTVGDSAVKAEANIGKLKLAVVTTNNPFDVKKYWYEADSANPSKTPRLSYESSQELSPDCRYEEKMFVYLWDWELYAEAALLYKKSKAYIVEEEKEYAADRPMYLFDRLGIGYEPKEENSIIKTCRPYLDTIQTREEAISILTSMIAEAQISIFSLPLVEHVRRNENFWGRGVWKDEGYMYFTFEEKMGRYLEVGVGWQHETQTVHPAYKSANLRIMICGYDMHTKEVLLSFQEDMIDQRIVGIDDVDLRHIKSAIAGYKILKETMLASESRRLLARYDKATMVELDKKREEQAKKLKFVKPFERVTVCGINFKVIDRHEAHEYLKDLKHPTEGYPLYDVYVDLIDELSDDEEFEEGHILEDNIAFYLLADEEVVVENLVLNKEAEELDCDELYIFGYIFTSKLTVTKSVISSFQDYSPPLICLGEAKIKNGFFAGDAHYFGNGLEIGFCYGVYNHGSLIVKNGMSFELLIFDDFRGYADFFTNVGGIVLEAASLFTEYDYEDESGEILQEWNLVPQTFNLEDVLADNFLILNPEYGYLIRDDGYNREDEYKDGETTFFEMIKAGGDVFDTKKAKALDDKTVTSFHADFDLILNANRSLDTGEALYKKDSSDMTLEYFFIRNESDASVGVWDTNGEICIFITRDTEHNLKIHIGFYEKGKHEVSKFGFFGDLASNDLFSMAAKRVFRRAVKLLTDNS